MRYNILRSYVMLVIRCICNIIHLYTVICIYNFALEIPVNYLDERYLFPVSFILEIYVHK